jgi:hypothetical protein
MAVPQVSVLRFYGDPDGEEHWPNASEVLRPLGHQSPMLCPKLQLLSLQCIRVPDPELLKSVSLLRSGREISPDDSNTESREGASSSPVVLLVTIESCRGPQDVSKANYEELCEALDEYYSDDEHVYE